MKKSETEITLSRIGYHIEGFVKFRLQKTDERRYYYKRDNIGYIEIRPFRIVGTSPNTKSEIEKVILEKVKDHCFACESVDGVVAYVYDLYEHDFKMLRCEIISKSVSSSDMIQMGLMDDGGSKNE